MEIDINHRTWRGVVNFRHAYQSTCNCISLTRLWRRIRTCHKCLYHVRHVQPNYHVLGSNLQSAALRLHAFQCPLTLPSNQTTLPTALSLCLAYTTTPEPATLFPQPFLPPSLLYSILSYFPLIFISIYWLQAYFPRP